MIFRRLPIPFMFLPVFLISAGNALARAPDPTPAQTAAATPPSGAGVRIAFGRRGYGGYRYRRPNTFNQQNRYRQQQRMQQQRLMRQRMQQRQHQRQQQMRRRQEQMRAQRERMRQRMAEQRRLMAARRQQMLERQRQMQLRRRNAVRAQRQTLDQRRLATTRQMRAKDLERQQSGTAALAAAGATRAYVPPRLNARLERLSRRSSLPKLAPQRPVSQSGRNNGGNNGGTGGRGGAGGPGAGGNGSGPTPPTLRSTFNAGARDRLKSIFKARAALKTTATLPKVKRDFGLAGRKGQPTSALNQAAKSHKPSVPSQKSTAVVAPKAHPTDQGTAVRQSRTSAAEAGIKPKTGPLKPHWDDAVKPKPHQAPPGKEGGGDPPPTRRHDLPGPTFPAPQ